MNPGDERIRRLFEAVCGELRLDADGREHLAGRLRRGGDWELITAQARVGSSDRVLMDLIRAGAMGHAPQPALDRVGQGPAADQRPGRTYR